MDNTLYIGGDPANRNSLKAVSPDDLARNRDRNVIPRFFTVMEKNNEGVFIEKECLELLVPGDPKSSPCHLVDDRLREMYANHYKAFKEHREMPMEGTPIEQWLGAEDPRVMVMRSLLLRTVENVAVMNDVAMKSLGMGAGDLRARARRFLEIQKDANVADAMASKDAKLDEQGDMIAALSKRLAELEGRKVEAPVVEDESTWPNVDSLEVSTMPQLRKLLDKHDISWTRHQTKAQLLELCMKAREE